LPIDEAWRTLAHHRHGSPVASADKCRFQRSQFSQFLNGQIFARILSSARRLTSELALFSYPSYRESSNRAFLVSKSPPGSGTLQKNRKADGKSVSE